MAARLSIDAFTPSPTASSRLEVMATAQLSPGVARPSSRRYRLIQMFDDSAELPNDITFTYTKKFGALVSGKKIFFRLRWISRNGIPSAPFFTTVLVS